MKETDSVNGMSVYQVIYFNFILHLFLLSDEKFRPFQKIYGLIMQPKDAYEYKKAIKDSLR